MKKTIDVLCIEQGISKSMLSEKAGFSKNNLGSQLKNQGFSFKKLLSLAEAFNIKPSELLRRYEEIEGKTIK